MNLLAILKALGILWKFSKPVAERVIREDEYKKIKREQADLADRVKRDMHDDQLHPTGNMEAWAGEDGSDTF